MNFIYYLLADVCFVKGTGNRFLTCFYIALETMVSVPEGIRHKLVGSYCMF